MNSQPLVSIVVPMYNAEKYLQECVDSILNQSYKNLQIIIVDDGSTDSSKNIVKSYMEKEKRIELIEQENLYAGVARNNGMRYAKGKYIMFLDADDFFDENMIEKMCRKAEETEADIVICDSRKYDQEKERFDILSGALNREYLPKKKVFSKRDVSDKLFMLTNGWVWDKLFRRDFILEKEIDFLPIKNSEDQYFLVIAFTEANRIAITGEKFVTHRTNVRTSLEYNRFKDWRCSLEMLVMTKKELERRNQYSYVRKDFINLAVNYILGNIIPCNDYSVYVKYYNLAKVYMFGDLEITLQKSDYISDYFYEQVSNIKKLDANDYLINSRFLLIENANESDYWLRMQSKYIDQVNRKKKWVFPDDMFEPGSKIVVYGYGEVGQDFCWQIKNSKYFQLVGIVDRKLKTSENNDIKVINLHDLNKEKYDYIIIAIMNREVAEEVKKTLVSKGCELDIIVWVDLQ